MKKKPTDPMTRRLFPCRRTRIPARVQAASELWLDMFLNFCDGLLATRDGNGDGSLSDPSAQSLIESARVLADAALHEFEQRWPEVKL